jgi:hypothetical protein
MSEAEAEIRELEAAGRQATLDNDAAWHRTNLHDEWISINANGSMTTKSQLLRLIGATPFHFEGIEDREVQVRSFGADLCVVTGVSTRQRVTAERREVAVVRFARTYRLEMGQWKQVVSHQTSLM